MFLFLGKQFSLDSRIDLVIHNLDLNCGWKNADVGKQLAVEGDAIAEDVGDTENKDR